MAARMRSLIRPHTQNTPPTLPHLQTISPEWVYVVVVTWFASLPLLSLSSLLLGIGVRPPLLRLHGPPPPAKFDRSHRRVRAIDTLALPRP